MNWEAVSALAELGGVVAVVASLIYVAVQVKQNTREIRSAAVDSAISSIREWQNILLQAPENFEVFWKGLHGLDRLKSEDRGRFMFIAFSFFKTFENFHYKYEAGDLDEEVWSGWSAMLSSFIDHPGLRTYWDLRRDAFTPAFAQWIDNAVPPDSVPKTADAVAMSSGDSQDV